MSGDDWLADLASQLIDVAGVRGIMLGGSRARGDHAESSDYDIGIYYRPPLDTDALAALARSVAGAEATVTEPGDWGPWVDGGAWLSIAGRPVDWIYRRVDRVEKAWLDAQQGRFQFNAQTGHPFGVPDFAYAGEVALGTVLQDVEGRLVDLHQQTVDYPPALSDALIARLREADFLIGGLRKAQRRTDSVWLAGCLFRVVMVCVHALHGRAGRWLVNEKGAVDSAARLPVTPPRFANEARSLLGRLGESPAELELSLSRAEELVTACRSAVE